MDLEEDFDAMIKRHEAEFEKMYAEIAEQKKINAEQEKINAEIKARITKLKVEVSQLNTLTRPPPSAASLFMSQLSEVLTDRISDQLNDARREDKRLHYYLVQRQAFIQDLLRRYPLLLYASSLLRRQYYWREKMVPLSRVPPTTVVEEYKKILNLSSQDIEALDQAIDCLAHLNSVCTPARERNDMTHLNANPLFINMTESPAKAAREDEDHAKDSSNNKKNLVIPYETLIDGLELVYNFLTKEEASDLLRQIKQQKWSTDLTRRTQQYGFKYEYKLKDTLSAADPIPPFLNTLGERVKASGRVKADAKFDQVIVNEYRNGQGIAAHIDNTVLFDDEIVSISLGAPTQMRFNKGGMSVFVNLPPRSMLCIKGEARNEWTHGLYAHKHTTPRVSVTFRSTKKKDETK